MLAFIDYLLWLALAGLFAATFYYPAIQLGHVILCALIIVIFLQYRSIWYTIKVRNRVYLMPVEVMTQLIKNLLGK